MSDDNTHLKYTLLFGGGAVRGIAYSGTFKAIEELNIEFNTLAGSSVGAVFAALVAVGYTSDEIKNIFLKVNYDLFRDIQIGIGSQFALSKGEVFLDWMRELIEKKYYGESYKKGTHRAVTFGDIEKNLVIITTDLSNFECKEFSKAETSDFEIAKAVRISSGMPGLMKPVEYNNRVLVDGDLQKSAPMWSLSKNLQPDDERIVEFRLEGDFQGNDHNAIEYANAIYSYATSTGTKFLTKIYGCRDNYDYITIDTGDLNIIDFNVSEEKRLELIENGYKQTIEYFKSKLITKKQNLLSIYKAVLHKLDMCESQIFKGNISQAKCELGELYMNLCDDIILINNKDRDCLNHFKEIFIANYKTPALFGKSKLKNEKLVTTELKSCKQNISERVDEFSAYIEMFRE